jgi:hypothetical protein
LHGIMLLLWHGAGLVTSLIVFRIRKLFDLPDP